MAGIPLPALAVKGPDPAEMMQAFLGVGRLQQQAAAQRNDYQLAQQQNAMAQQRLAMEQQKQQAAMQQLAQQQQDAKIFNEGLSKYYQNGKVDADGLIKYLHEQGYSGDFTAPLQSVGALQELHQKLEAGQIKTLQDKASTIANLAPYLAPLPPGASYSMLQHALSTIGDQDGLKMLSSMTPDQVSNYIKQLAMSQAPIIKVDPGQVLMQRDQDTGKLVTIGQGPEPTQKPKIFSGIINGQPGVAMLDTSTGQYKVIPGLKPNPSFTEVYGPVAAAREVAQPTTKYVDDSSKVDAVLNAINQGASGSQLANGVLSWLGAMMTTGAGGIHRLNMVEISQMSPSAQSAARRIEAGWDKFISGQVPPGYVNDLKRFAESYRDILYRRYIANLAGSTASFPGGIDSIQALTPDRNGTVPLKQALAGLSKSAAAASQKSPSGAFTVKVIGNQVATFPTEAARDAFIKNHKNLLAEPQ